MPWRGTQVMGHGRPDCGSEGRMQRWDRAEDKALRLRGVWEDKLWSGPNILYNIPIETFALTKPHTCRVRSWESKRLEGVAMGVKGDVSDMSPPTATVPWSYESFCSATNFYPGRQNYWAYGNVLFRFSQREGPHSVLWNDFYSKWHN